MCIEWQGLRELKAKVAEVAKEWDDACDDYENCKRSKDEWKNRVKACKKTALDAGEPDHELRTFWETLPTNLEELQEKTRLLESEADNLVGDKTILQVSKLSSTGSAQRSTSSVHGVRRSTTV
eukprot:COSAG01_NODE_4200_length_5248_cov_4.151097_6_plen_123_part_00